MQEKIKKSAHKRLLDVTFISLFAALCYIALSVFFFPLGPMFIHFGNLIVVVAALLIGGWQGGLSGAIGMGLYDILNGHADSSPKTLILKFLIGFTVGLGFTLLKKRLKNKTIAAAIGAVCGMLVNIIGEILWKTVQFSLAGSQLSAAFAASVLAQGSTLVNAIIAVIAGTAIFTFLEKPFNKILSR